MGAVLHLVYYHTASIWSPPPSPPNEITLCVGSILSHQIELRSALWKLASPYNPLIWKDMVMLLDKYETVLSATGTYYVIFKYHPNENHEYLFPIDILETVYLNIL